MGTRPTQVDGNAEVYHKGVQYWLNEGEVTYPNYLAGFATAETKKLVFSPTVGEPDRIYYFAKGIDKTGGYMDIALDPDQPF